MQAISPYGVLQDVINVDSVTIRNSAEQCGQVTGEKVYIDIEMSCKSGALYEDCEARIIISGDINYDSTEFHISEGQRINKTVDFTMPSNDVNFNIVVRECDLATPDDIAYNRNHTVPNVTREERDACSPIVPPIDLSKIDPTFVVIGATLGGVAGVATEGKEGFMSFALIGGGLALAYSYLTSTTK